MGRLREDAGGTVGEERIMTNLESRLLQKIAEWEERYMNEAYSGGDCIVSSAVLDELYLVLDRSPGYQDRHNLLERVKNRQKMKAEGKCWSCRHTLHNDQACVCECAVKS